MVIEPDSWADWLDPANNDAADLSALLAPAMASGLATYPVSTEVNSVRNNGPQLIEREVDPGQPVTGPRVAATRRCPEGPERGVRSGASGRRPRPRAGLEPPPCTGRQPATVPIGAAWPVPD